MSRKIVFPEVKRKVCKQWWFGQTQEFRQALWIQIELLEESQGQQYINLDKLTIFVGGVSTTILYGFITDDTILLIPL